jgi:hypothetical protein
MHALTAAHVDTLFTSVADILTQFCWRCNHK